MIYLLLQEVRNCPIISLIPRIIEIQNNSIYPSLTLMVDENPNKKTLFAVCSRFDESKENEDAKLTLMKKVKIQFLNILIPYYRLSEAVYGNF